MHSFNELADRCTTFTLQTLSEVSAKINKELQVSASTVLIKNLQMIQLQKTILAVGMFSIFEANLQDSLESKDGFAAAKKILDSEGEIILKEHFEILFLAINVLKHGRGRSYDALIARTDLPFRVKRPDESFIFEGDVSEVSTLIEVDDAFVLLCSNTITAVSQVISRVHKDNPA